MAFLLCTRELPDEQNLKRFIITRLTDAVDIKQLFLPISTWLAVLGFELARSTVISKLVSGVLKKLLNGVCVYIYIYIKIAFIYFEREGKGGRMGETGTLM